MTINLSLLCSLSTSIVEHVAEFWKPKFYVPASAPSVEQTEHVEHWKSGRNLPEFCILLKICYFLKNWFCQNAQLRLAADWAFQDFLSFRNGWDHIAEAIQSGHSLEVSDGSFKDSFGTTAWILTDNNTAILASHTTVPGIANKQGSFYSNS